MLEFVDNNKKENAKINEFARKLVTKIRILSDLLQVSAIQGKKNETSPLLRRLIHELMDFIAGSENISASVDADLLSSFQPLVLVFLEGISRISTLDELAIAWIRNSHEAMFDTHHNMMSPESTKKQQINHHIIKNESGEFSRRKIVRHNFSSILDVNEGSPIDLVQAGRMKRHVFVFLTCFGALVDAIRD